jgi:NAD(P)-dependent dehydrogenase (short-subunit alcohol dehydrogenase family)
MTRAFAARAVIITGGSSGIGRATAERFHAEGARVVSLDREVRGDVPFTEIACDVSFSESVSNAVAEAAALLGAIDIVVNNVGVSAVGTIEENDDAEWARVLNINVTSIARVSRAALPWLRASDAAAIVNVCSIAALNGLPRRALYGASKGAVLALTYAMATDHVSEGIRVNAVSPGTVSTEFVERMLAGFPDPQAERAALHARQATGRMVEPAEVASAILYLASPHSGSTTGTALEVDGGVTHLRARATR